MQIISSTRFSSTRQHLDEVIPMSQMACHFSCGPPRRTRSKTNFISLFILVFAALIIAFLLDKSWTKSLNCHKTSHPRCSVRSVTFFLQLTADV
ncbi:hypothetical protein TGGT1_263327 [Toxoplasma gondii GT1]|uniref:Transmembrane protein n=2 Tax=Toxoplasma gondii TaxID=5811 RepID=S7UXN7_TOXGG|nr:hypothetical protein TGGT1_263327 [Toxoplasma gondii GT1]RQX71538.1 putative transmembrane protein [Toxoplasma gondii CAST]